MEALALFARIAESLSAEARRLRFIALVQTLAASVALELDLRMEAAAAATTSTSVCTVCFHRPWLMMKSRPRRTPSASAFER